MSAEDEDEALAELDQMIADADKVAEIPEAELEPQLPDVPSDKIPGETYVMLAFWIPLVSRTFRKLPESYSWATLSFSQFKPFIKRSSDSDWTSKHTLEIVLLFRGQEREGEEGGKSCSRGFMRELHMNTVIHFIFLLQLNVNTCGFIVRIVLHIVVLNTISFIRGKDFEEAV